MIIQSVSRALSILSLFSPTTTHLGITEIGKLLGLKNQTVHGLVRTLVFDGFLAQDDKTKKYCLGIKNFEIGHYFLGASQVYQVAAAPSAHLGLPKGTQIPSSY
jgi:IclR family transcriptional regulator, KDG regulon repressor